MLNSIRHLLVAFFVITAYTLISGLTGYTSARAQGTAYVQIDGLPPVLESPLLSDLERKYRQGAFRVQFVLISPTRQLQSFQFRLSLEHNGEELLEMTSEPLSFEPGVYSYATFDEEPAILFPLSYEDWLNQLNPDLSNTGILAEGDYVLKIEAIATDPNSLVPSIPGVALFTVRYAEPPLLLTPPDEASISAQLPIFSWTPVTGTPLASTIEYELLITEVFSDQTPAQALESNIEHVHKAFVEQTSFVYAASELPLEPGKVYAWQVQARDIHDQLPILDRGETEIYTFSILGEGFGTGLTAWSFPISSPFLRYDFEQSQDLDPNESELFFDDYLPIDLLGVSTQATFDNVLVDIETQRIIEGSIQLDHAFALEVEINPLNDTFTGYRAVSTGSNLSLNDGLLLNLGSDVLIDAEGLHPRGTHAAKVSYSGYGSEQWTATYSADLVLDFSPFRITRGRIDFAADGIAKGYADPSGFRLSSQNDPVIAQLPDRLMIDEGRVGYIPLKSGTTALVNLEEEPGGLRLTPQRPGALELVLPAFQQGYQTQGPRFDVKLDNVLIDAATGNLIEGSIAATVVDTLAPYSLDYLGIPIAPQEYRIQQEDGAPQVEIEGLATLFGEPLMDAPSVTLQWGADQRISGEVMLDSLDAFVWLDPQKQEARLSVRSVTGIVDAPLSSPLNSFFYDVGGELDILANGSLAAQADINLTYKGSGSAAISDLNAKALNNPAVFGLKDHALHIEEITSVDIFYSQQRGLEYSAALDTRLESGLQEHVLTTPLKDVEITDTGIHIPLQEHHTGTPGFERHLFTQAGHHFELLSVRLPAVQIETQKSDQLLVTDLLARYDFEVHLEHNDLHPQALLNAPLTLQGATIEEGIVTGPILPFSFSTPVQWTWEGATYLIKKLSGSFVAENGDQAEELLFAGDLQLSQLPDSPSCIIPDLRIRQTQQGIESSSASFIPCESFHIGQLAIELGESTINIDSLSPGPSLIVEGELLDISSSDNKGEIIEPPGQIALNLSSNSILSADAQVSSISLLLPANNPLFQVELSDATLGAAGFSVSDENSASFSSIHNDETYAFEVKETFTLGWSPEISNVGRGDLISTSAEDPELIGYFDESGYHPVESLASIPQGPIPLPGVSGAALLLPEEANLSIETGRRSQEGFVLRTTNEAFARLSIPILGTQTEPLLLDVPLDIQTNEAFAYASGVIKQDYSESPIELEASGYPIRIMGIEFDPEEPLGERLLISGELANPFAGDFGADVIAYLPFEGTIGLEGLRGKLGLDKEVAIYENTLSFLPKTLVVTHSSGTNHQIQFEGEVTSPLFSSSAKPSFIGIRGVFSAQNKEWDYALTDHQPSSLSIGSFVFQTQPETGFVLNTDTGFELSLAGAFQFPEQLDPSFSLGAMIDIGRDGVVLWPNDELWGTQSLFGGVISAAIDAFNFAFDPQTHTVLTTIDGAFLTELTSRTTNDNRIPFSGLQLSSAGTLSLSENISTDPNTSFSPAESRNLLANQSNIRLIDDALAFTSITLSNDSSGLSLNLGGQLYLPNYRSYTPGFNIPKFNTALPVAIQVGRNGSIINSKTTWYKSDLTSMLTERAPSDVSFEYQGVVLDFDPLLPSQAQILASAALHVNDITTHSASQSSETPVLTHDNSIKRGISLGSHSNPLSHPGLIIREERPVTYLISDSPVPDKPLFKINGDLTYMQATHVSLRSSEEPVFTISGRSFLSLDGFAGYFPISDLTIDPRGVTSLGTLQSPTVLSFLNIASFELNCFDHSQNNVSSYRNENMNTFRPSTRSGIDPVEGPFDAQIRFGKFCGSSLPLTITDRWFTGTYDEFDISNDSFSSPSVQINGVDLTLSSLASFEGAFTYENTNEEPYFLVDGETSYRNVELTSTGSLKTRDGLPSLSILFSPARSPLELIPDYAIARIPGGGLFLRPTESEIDLVSLTLNERSNNSFSSNYPDAELTGNIKSSDQLSVITPIELSIDSGRSSLDLSGIGVLQSTEQFTYLDLDGALYDDAEKLQTDFFLIERSHEGFDQNSSMSGSLEGLANISLNYTSVIGGVIPANFNLQYAPDVAPAWYANGSSEFLLTDTIKLPGSFVITSAGFALNLKDKVNINQRHISLDDEFDVFLWKLREANSLQGYTSFTSSIDLLPGYMLNQDKMYGALIQDRDEYQIYAARNQYADIPYVFNGPLDPWLSFQDGQTFGGDARNSVFKRMIQDARVSSQKITGLTEEATASLQDALDLQLSIAQTPILAKNLSTFTQSNNQLSLLGDRMGQIGSQFLGEDSLSPLLKSIREQLYFDEERPERNYVAGQPYASDLALEAFNQMQSSIANARRSAEIDIYAFQTISPRPLLWLAEPLDLTPVLEISPIQLSDHSSKAHQGITTFSVDPTIAQQQINNLILFKQNNESVDSQFLRAVGGLEINLVNLKTARSPEQAFDFEIANNSIRQFYTQQIADDWDMLDWINQKRDWLISQESAIERASREKLPQLTELDDASNKLRQLAIDQHNLASEIAENSTWKREELTDGITYQDYVNNLSSEAVETEFSRSAKHLWYDAPLASLSMQSDSLSALIDERIEQFKVHSDTLNKASGRFSKALDPLYDVQTQYTTTLFGMADEYRIWRSSIRGLDPEEVHLALQFTPYRGNYRILSEDLTPPIINDILITPNTEGYLNQTVINWDAEHPVELAEISLSITETPSQTTYFTSLGTNTSTSYSTTKTETQQENKDISLTLRARGAGGIPVIKKGQFKVPVSPSSNLDTQEDQPLVPFDQTPPPSPVISALNYSSYFSENPNTLQFSVDPLRDPDSGIERVEYRVESDNGKNLIQDWTTLPISTTYFGGRLVETSLPVQEDDITVVVSVRITNGSGLTSIASEELDLDLDVSPPNSSIKDVLYFDAFENSNANSLAIEIIDIFDEESGIDKVEYTITKEAQANLANAIWSGFVTLPDRARHTGAQTVFIPLSDQFIAEASNNLSVFIRATNGAGLQNVTRSTIQVPGKDLSPPTEPSVTLEHTGFYTLQSPNHLRIIVGNSRDLESGIQQVLYRVLDGQTGKVIYDWDDFVLINPAYPTFIVETTEKLIPLPSFKSSRPVIVEVQSINRAGLLSAKTIRFLPLELDVTPPIAPVINATYFSARSPIHPNSLQLDVGLIQDPESPLTAIEYQIIDRENQLRQQAWTPLLQATEGTHVFPGTVQIIPSPTLSPDGKAVIQVRSTNRQGLSSVASHSITVERDDTPPMDPFLQVHYSAVAETNRGILHINIGESYDPQTFINKVRYRISDFQQADSSSAHWQNIQIDAPINKFEGATIDEPIPALRPGSRYLVDVEIINGAGLSSRSSAILDHTLFTDTDLTEAKKASIELFYFDPANTIRSNELEITVTPTENYATGLDSIQYKIDFNDGTEDGAELSTPSSFRPAWTSVRRLQATPSGQYHLFAPLPEGIGSFTAQVHLRLFYANGQVSEITQYYSASSVKDQTPPELSELDAIYYGPSHPNKANQLDLVLNNIEDPQTRISHISYRIIDPQNRVDLSPDWKLVAFDTNTGVFPPTVVSVDLPEWSESTTLTAEVRSINGQNIESTASIPISIEVDKTPPEFENIDIFIEDATTDLTSDKLLIHLYEVLDPESQIRSLDYRVSITEGTNEPIIDWTPIGISQAHVVRHPELAFDLPENTSANSLLVELRAQNEAGLTTNHSEEVKRERDKSAPQLQQVQASYRVTKSGSGYLYIEPGSFRDPESNIAKIEYRLLSAQNDNQVYLSWREIPIQEDLRVQVSPITISRQLLPFDASETIAIEFRATNGEGLSETRRTTAEIPGDITPPTPSTLMVHHRNGYDPRYPNTIEVQIGPSKDDQSSIRSVQYRITNLTSREEILSWTSLPVSNNEVFPGKVLFAELPFLSRDIEAEIEIEITNSAGLIRNVSETVTIQTAGDVSPPALAISSHFFSDEIAIVLDELSDIHSRIQRVEYRLVDNVDQSILSDWVDLFEILNPQERYSTQSYRISPPAIRDGRAIKIEVRATNGAGLQSTMSKTLLYQQPESN